MQILLVEPDSTQSRRLVRMLRASGARFRLNRALRLCDAKLRLQKSKADVALIDLCLPDAKGLAIIREAHQAAPGVPLVVLTNRRDDSIATEALHLGAQDVLLKTELNPHQLNRALSFAIARHQAQASLRNLSLTDELTGLHNRRGFVNFAEQHLKLAVRQNRPSTLVFIDVDDLKYINDSFGHREGDAALKQTARILRECFRESDIIGRIGGDEFCALLSDTPDMSELPIRRRLASLFAKSNDVSKSPYRLSISLGVVDVAGPYELERQIARADVLMYEHKRGKQGCAEATNADKEHSVSLVRRSP